ncbi:DNA polymerase III subunit delta [Microbulbifer sp. SH-1]|uniref:DNA polymerase III subunit delta n=1 Tax=Microbulbifer sp. SH-1 TaxID=2681547 RepID=UPI001408B652|nr:DNA polymerase III subunit delta [Microbulbifer sp. SH-1]QIL89739.1 DNA polymerase III subunit delta [Microbulbifer sp. SH-1]
MARITPRQLGQNLRQSIAPIYVVTGDEPLLVQECCDSIRDAARKHGFNERDLLHGENNFDWGQLLSAAGSLSLFADKKIIELRLPGGKPGDKGSKALQEFASMANDETLLLLVLPRLDRAQLNSKWVKALEERGVLIQIWPVDASEMPRWIHERLRSAGLDAEPEAIQILAERAEGNLLAASQEIEKLKLLARDSVITADTMSNAVASSARYDVFGLIDKALAADAAGAVRTLQGLRAEGVEAAVVLWAIAREIRTLLETQQKLDQGQPINRLVRIQKRQPLIQAACQRLRPRQLENFLLRARAVDNAIKGGRDMDPWAGLLELTLNLSGKRSI